MIKIAIPGSGGRMGGMLTRAIAVAPDLELVAATDLPDSPFIGRDAGEVAQIGANGVMIGSDPETLFGVADVVIDFTSPAASIHHASLAAAKGTAMDWYNGPSCRRRGGVEGNGKRQHNYLLRQYLSWRDFADPACRGSGGQANRRLGH